MQNKNRNPDYKKNLCFRFETENLKKNIEMKNNCFVIHSLKR